MNEPSQKGHAVCVERGSNNSTQRGFFSFFYLRFHPVSLLVSLIRVIKLPGHKTERKASYGPADVRTYEASICLDTTDKLTWQSRERYRNSLSEILYVDTARMGGWKEGKLSFSVLINAFRISDDILPTTMGAITMTMQERDMEVRLP